MIIPAFFACLSGLIFGLRYAATIRANQVVAAPPAPVPAPTPAPRPAPTPVEGGDGESVPLLSPSVPAAASPPQQWFADDSPICPSGLDQDAADLAGFGMFLAGCLTLLVWIITLGAISLFVCVLFSYWHTCYSS